MKILHTSDWHLDCKLFNQRRTDEHTAFFAWLRQTIIDNQVNALVVSGDIFDNRVPTLESQRLYIDFLMELYDDAKSGKSVCSNIVIIGGNHDSATLLELNKPILQHLNISVAAKKPADWNQAVIELKDKTHTIGIVAAFPFLSDIDLRKSVDGETALEKTTHLMEGIRDAYRQLEAAAVQKRNLLDKSEFIPIIATGHLFAQGGKTIDQDGVRDIYIGTLEKFPAGDFPAAFDYIALGHLHVPQTVNKSDYIRYSGSPIPIGFNEAGQSKQVVLAEWNANGERIITPLEIPQFQKIVQISGDEKTITAQVEQTIAQAQSDGVTIWIEVVYRSEQPPMNLKQNLEELLNDKPVLMLAFRCETQRSVSLTAQFKGESLKELTPIDVFKRTLKLLNVSEDLHKELMEMYTEVINQNEIA